MTNETPKTNIGNFNCGNTNSGYFPGAFRSGDKKQRVLFSVSDYKDEDCTPYFLQPTQIALQSFFTGE